jgi:hypothetical protein
MAGRQAAALLMGKPCRRHIRDDRQHGSRGCGVDALAHKFAKLVG